MCLWTLLRDKVQHGHEHGHTNFNSFRSPRSVAQARHSSPCSSWSPSVRTSMPARASTSPARVRAPTEAVQAMLSSPETGKALSYLSGLFLIAALAAVVGDLVDSRAKWASVLSIVIVSISALLQEKFGANHLSVLVPLGGLLSLFVPYPRVAAVSTMAYGKPARCVLHPGARARPC